MDAIANNFQTDNYSILVTWDMYSQTHYPDSPDTYIIRISSCGAVEPVHIVYTNTTTYTIEGQYNTMVQVNISTANCAGASEQVTLDVYEGDA